MPLLVHPAKEDITLAGVLTALADPVRLQIVAGLMRKQGCMSCTEAAPCPDIAKSTLSNHFRILRASGLIRTVKQGVEHRSVIRRDDIEARFPGLLALVVDLAGREAAHYQETVGG